MMENFNIICGYCNNPLYDNGVIIHSGMGPLLMCSVCRGLYYIDIVVSSATEKFSLVVQVMNLAPEEEFEIIRNSSDHMPLAKYFTQHFNHKPAETANLKEVIASSVTPSDFLRKLNSNE
jgi:hypothetical protein